VLWAAASALIGYPDADLVTNLPTLSALLSEAAASSSKAATPLLRLVAWLRDRPLLAVQQHYVATFDTKRRCCPYLTYYLHGDTRRRGVALWRVKAALAGCGFEPARGELPDHLCVLAELAATGDENVAIALLDEHRTGLTLLRSALEHARSPYAAVVDAVEALLPPADAAQARAAQAAAVHLAVSGPPAELVGLPGRLTPFTPGGHAESADHRGARR
jgi:nitrate reductase delta subunit